MKPVKTNHTNVTFAENQPEYQPLPVHKLNDGTVTSCWEFEGDELETIARNNCIYIQQLTFNEPLQPILLMAEYNPGPDNTTAIRKINLFELMEMLPDELEYQGNTIRFALTKGKNADEGGPSIYNCTTFYTEPDTDDAVPFIDSTLEFLEFNSPSPETAISMMIAFLKLQDTSEWNVPDINWLIENNDKVNELRSKHGLPPIDFYKKREEFESDLPF